MPCVTPITIGIYSEAIASFGWHDLNPWLYGRQVRLSNDHFDPILFLVIPLASLVGPTAALHCFDLMTPLCASAAMLWLYHDGVLQARATLILTLLCLFNTAMLEALHFPAHPTTWAMAPMVWLVVLVYRERYRAAVLALLLLFCCKEEFPFAGAALALALLAPAKPQSILPRRLSPFVFPSSAQILSRVVQGRSKSLFAVQAKPPIVISPVKILVIFKITLLFVAALVRVCCRQRRAPCWRLTQARAL